MSSRPQFSLRMLLLVVVMASLIAATVAPTGTAASAAIALLGLLWVATLTLVALALAKPPYTGFALRVREHLIITLSMALQGSLAVGAVRSRGAVRAFCTGAALASCLAWALVCQTLLADAVNRGNLFYQFRPVSSHPYSFAAARVFAPIFGLACALFHHLFRLGDTLDKAPANPAEKPGCDIPS